MTASATHSPTTSAVAAIERIRASSPAEIERPTQFQMRTLINGIQACNTLADVAQDAFGPFLPTEAWVTETQAAEAFAASADKEGDAALKEALAQVRAAARVERLEVEVHFGMPTYRAGDINQLLAQLRVLDLVAKFGTWLTHVNGGSKVETVLGVDKELLPLFQTPVLAESEIRPALLKRGKRFIPFAEATAVEQGRAIRLPADQLDALAALVDREGEDAAKAHVEEIIASRERRAALQHVGQDPQAQAAAVKAARERTIAFLQQQLSLFGDTTVKRPRWSNRGGRKPKRAPAAEDSSKVVIPPGFERQTWHRRDVARALAAIVVTDPDDDTIARFIANTYQKAAKVLTFPHLTMVWFFTRLDRLDEIDQINPKSPVLTELLVDAYDLLDVTRQDAVEALRMLVAADLKDQPELDALASACTRASWLAEAELAKVARLISSAMARPSATSALGRELGFLKRRIEANEAGYLPDSVKELTEGQVRRIAAAAGLDVENDDRVEVAEIRQALKDYGFEADLDRLVPLGVRAVQAGRREDFFEVMDARKSGDTGWTLRLEALFDSADVDTKSTEVEVNSVLA